MIASRVVPVSLVLLCSTSLALAADGGSWKEVEKLIGEQKLEAAAQAAHSIREAARKSGDEREWTRALIKEVQLRIGLHGYESSVRFLREQPRPKAPTQRMALELYYAQALVSYLGAYSYEIRQREKVESQASVDLKSWTRDQILHEAQTAYQNVWRARAELGSEPVESLSELVTPPTYPAHLRGTLRDALSYLAVELLANSAHWRPEESNELYRLKFKALLAGDPSRAKSLRVDDVGVHPLERALAVLDDLESWHRQSSRPEASLEARLERLRRLASSFSADGERKAMRDHLATRLRDVRGVAWWAVGQALLAEMVRDHAGDLVTARRLAEEGGVAYPGTIGGARCQHLVAAISAPDYSLLSMSSDGAGRRSLEVSYRNLKALYFRAYKVDLARRIETASGYDLLPSWNEARALVQSGTVASEWSTALRDAGDYQSHKTYVIPPLTESGLYVIVASTRRDFAEEQNRVLAVNLIVSELVLTSRIEGSQGLFVTAVSGDSGLPAEGVSVSLYRYDWKTKHQRVETKLTDAHGVARFAYSETRANGSYFLYARKDGAVALDAQHLSFYRDHLPREVLSSFVYTDRSLYRPLQKLFFKVVAYRGDRSGGAFKVAPKASLSIGLRDPNNDLVETQTLTTNEFGSAAGEFTLPAGRLLGRWRLDSSVSGSTYFRVEEYKRPSFEIALEDPKQALRLNQPVRLSGEAKYYFGLPVGSGDVRWRVQREPVYPWWWYGEQPGAGDGRQTIGAGVSALKDGRFDLSFTAEADERLAKTSPDVSYRYTVTADLTDEGGETRSASRSFRLGLKTVEASVSLPVGFFRQGQPSELGVTRTSLDGLPRAGQGTYRIVSLRQPPVTGPPAELPMVVRERNTFRRSLPSDALRARWAHGYSPEQTMSQWADGDERAEGALSHGSDGVAKLSLPPLAPGAYRLRYETADELGAKVETWKEFVVVGERTPLALPLYLAVESPSVAVGGTARLFIHSGLANQLSFVEIFRDGKPVDRRRLSSDGSGLVELPIREKDRGGFTVTVWTLRDHQAMSLDRSIRVGWDNKALALEFGTFRDRLRPGSKETWTVKVKDHNGAAVGAAAEVLAYMYDRSLDAFGKHHWPSPLGVYPSRLGGAPPRINLGVSGGQHVLGRHFASLPDYPSLSGAALRFPASYGIGGPGRRANGHAKSKNGHGAAMRSMAPSASPPAPVMLETKRESQLAADAAPTEALPLSAEADKATARGGERPGPELRENFSETAFFRPQLVVDQHGVASIGFEVPDSVTAWNVWVHAITKDLRSGVVSREVRTVKELMVRPYLPRFFREGDQAELKIVVNRAVDDTAADNAEKALSGEVSIDIVDPETQQSVRESFGLAAGRPMPFQVSARGSANLTVPLTVPRKVGPVAFKVVARAGDFTDGELRPLPVLPSRVRLAQSRFAALQGKDKRSLHFADLAKNLDPTRIDEQLVVTLDAQLFSTVLQALPYLVDYPYECTEQTLNRFVSTAIVESTYRKFPAVAAMAARLAKRPTRLETFDTHDPNRKMSLEETPWLEEARGGGGGPERLVNVLDPRIAKADREASLAKLQKAQTVGGGFPWFAGGPPSPYMTLYLMHGFAKATEFGVEVPKDLVRKGWQYLARHYREEYLGLMREKNCCWEFVTFLNYVASSYPDASWTQDAVGVDERKEMLAFSFAHWQQHSPYLKAMLALTLKRMGREKDGVMVFESVLDSAKTAPDQGTFWAAEDRSWLWYNDTIESHAFALRTLTELAPRHAKRDGLVLWLFLNKKLNHWKSTKATAEAIYALVHYLEAEQSLAVKEEARVSIGDARRTFTWDPEVYDGKRQMVVPGNELDPKKSSSITVEKETRGVMFASATWHFSTDALPQEERGDFFRVSRRYFRRENDGKQFVLRPLAEDHKLAPGDELEVQLSLRSKHAAEYVHLRDPRAAGLEPDISPESSQGAVSRYKRDQGLVWYEETRDSGANFFFEALPAGEYTFRYRLRAHMAGTFRVGPATVQSMYAPEFSAYSSGSVISVRNR